ncbi:phage head completion protein [Amycolatopsis lurida]|uniref:phage head completion protein n=1 Tax=Amycolatopsis lurida TaxID=31959 RepID=UPI00365B9BF3
MRFPHRLTVVTPVSVPDEYENPVPRLTYGPDAPRRTVAGFMQPGSSTEPAAPSRQAVVTGWRAFTAAPVTSRERIEWDGRTFEVSGEPARWSPRFGYVHYELTLTHVEG